MALLERRELLQRQRVDPAEQGQRPLGAAEPLLLLGADVRRRGPARPRAPRPGPAATAAPAGAARTPSTRASGSTPSSSSGPLLQRLDPQPLLGAGDLVAVHAVGEPLQLAGQLAEPGAQGAQLGVPLGPRVLGLRRGPPRRAPASAPDGRAAAWAASATSWATAASAGRADPAGLGLGPAGPLLGGGAVELVGAPGKSPDPLLAGPDGEPGLHLGLPRGAGGLLQLVAQRGVRLASSAPSGPRSWRRHAARRARRAAARSASSCSTAAAMDLSSRSASPRAARPGRRAARAARPRRPSGRPTRAAGRGPTRRPGWRAPGRRARPAARTGPARCGARPRPARAPASSTAACTSSRLGAVAEPPAARSRPSRSPSAVTATSPGRASTRRRARREVVDDDDVGQQPGRRPARSSSGTVDEVQRRPRAVRQLGDGGRRR